MALVRSASGTCGGECDGDDEGLDGGQEQVDDPDSDCGYLGLERLSFRVRLEMVLIRADWWPGVWRGSVH